MPGLTVYEKPLIARSGNTLSVLVFRSRKAFLMKNLCELRWKISFEPLKHLVTMMFRALFVGLESKPVASLCLLLM